jgi:hypothetical protein
MQVAGAHLHAIFGRIPFLHDDGTSSPEGVNSGKILREVSCHLFRLSVSIRGCGKLFLTIPNIMNFSPPTNFRPRPGKQGIALHRFGGKVNESRRSL